MTTAKPSYKLRCRCGYMTDYKRKRSLTLMTLNWLADRLKKTEAIKAKIASGEYNPDVKGVARAILDPKEIVDQPLGKTEE
jgi:hypothetical protein